MLIDFSLGRPSSFAYQAPREPLEWRHLSQWQMSQGMGSENERRDAGSEMSVQWQVRWDAVGMVSNREMGWVVLGGRALLRLDIRFFFWRCFEKTKRESTFNSDQYK